MSAAAARQWTTAELTADLLSRLRADGWLAVTEAVLETRWTGPRADILAMRRKLERRPMLIFELKTDRGDLLRDLRSEKWRAYLRSGAVTFALPQGLADPSEIPADAGLYVRITQGWSWRRAPKWAEAPAPDDYLYRRLAMSLSDQERARARIAEITARKVQYATRSELGRRLATIAADIDHWSAAAARMKAEYQDLYQRHEELRRAHASLQREAAE